MSVNWLVLFLAPTEVDFILDVYYPWTFCSDPAAPGICMLISLATKQVHLPSHGHVLRLRLRLYLHLPFDIGKVTPRTAAPFAIRSLPFACKCCYPGDVPFNSWLLTGARAGALNFYSATAALDTILSQPGEAHYGKRIQFPTIIALVFPIVSYAICYVCSCTFKLINMGKRWREYQELSPRWTDLKVLGAQVAAVMWTGNDVNLSAFFFSLHSPPVTFSREFFAKELVHGTGKHNELSSPGANGGLQSSLFSQAISLASFIYFDQPQSIKLAQKWPITVFIRQYENTFLHLSKTAAKNLCFNKATLKANYVNVCIFFKDSNLFVVHFIRRRWDIQKRKTNYIIFYFV